MADPVEHKSEERGKEAKRGIKKDRVGGNEERKEREKEREREDLKVRKKDKTERDEKERVSIGMSML